MTCTIITILALVGAHVIWKFFWDKKYFLEPKPDQIHYATTEDGWRIALLRYLPTGEKPHRDPVILCHGVGCNALTFDFGANSLARWLSSRGYDVYCIELRGHGRSEFPHMFSDKRWGWSCDTYLEQDIPAAIQLVTDLAGKSPHWLGLSMGGNLAYAWAALHPDSGLKSITTVGSSLDYSESSSHYHRIVPMLKWVSSFPFQHLPFVHSFLIPFSGRIANSMERFLVWEKNIEPWMIRTVYAHGFHPASTPVLQQLATLFDKGGMRSADGSRHYFNNLPAVKTPVFSIAGDMDFQCPTDATEKTHQWIGCEDKQFQVFGTEQGHGSSYGHMDLIFGTNAPKDVWPEVLKWLDAHR